MIKNLLLILIIGYFLTVSLLFLGRLGLDPDEAEPGLAALQLISPLPSYNILHNNSCLMRNDYEGMLENYIQALFFLLFGHNNFTVRIGHIIFSLGSLLCIYYVCGRWFGKWIGLITVLLLGTNSTFIRATRIGNIRDEILQISLFWIGIALIQLYIDRGKRRHLYLSAFIFGLALWAKIMFLGYFLGVMMAFAIFRRKSYEFFRTKIFKKKYDIFVYILLFILGSSPLWIYNFFSFGVTFNTLWHALWNVSTSGYNNLHFLNNLILRVNHFYILLLSHFWLDSIRSSKNYINIIFFCLSLLYVLSHLIFIKRDVLSKNKLSFFFITYFILFILTTFTPTGYTPEHIIITLPFIQVVCALFIGLIFVSIKNRILAFSLILMFLVPNEYAEFNIIKRVLTGIKNDEGSRFFSSVNYDLAHYLEDNDIKEIFCLTDVPIRNIDFITDRRVATWGLGSNISFFPSPFIAGENSDGYQESRVTFELVYKSKLKKLDSFYVVVEKRNKFSETTFEHLLKYIYRDKKRIKLIKDFVSTRGNTHLELYYIEAEYCDEKVFI